jgi:peptidoglycan/xylan/chitin deacetylase (PgdA/CDA1 family)
MPDDWTRSFPSCGLRRERNDAYQPHGEAWRYDVVPSRMIAVDGGSSGGMTRSLPILMYHQVTPQPPPAFRKYCVTPASFAAQMQWLALAGYVPVTIETLLDCRRGGAALPRRPVLITFDDGYRDCFDYAVPILHARKFTAMFFLIAGLTGGVSEWLIAERGVRLELMDWTAARELEATGLQCGSHSMSHPRLAELSREACRAELVDSRRLLEDRLGREIRHLAYPYGAYNQQVRNLAAEAGYLSACSVRLGLSSRDDDPLALHRVPVTGQDSLLDFICRLSKASTPAEIARGKTSALLRRLRQLRSHRVG